MGKGNKGVAPLADLAQRIAGIADSGADEAGAGKAKGKGDKPRGGGSLLDKFKAKMPVKAKK